MRSSLANRIAALMAAAHREAARVPVLHVHFNAGERLETAGPVCNKVAAPPWKPGDPPDLHIYFADKWKPGDPPPPSVTWLAGGESPQPRQRKKKSRRKQ
jgi:hypothetical protein